MTSRPSYFESAVGFDQSLVQPGDEPRRRDRRGRATHELPRVLQRQAREPEPTLDGFGLRKVVQEQHIFGWRDWWAISARARAPLPHIQSQFLVALIARRRPISSFAHQHHVRAQGQVPQASPICSNSGGMSTLKSSTIRVPGVQEPLSLIFGACSSPQACATASATTDHDLLAGLDLPYQLENWSSPQWIESVVGADVCGHAHHRNNWSGSSTAPARQLAQARTSRFRRDRSRRPPSACRSAPAR